MFSETRRLIDTIASYDEYGQKMACLAYSNSLTLGKSLVWEEKIVGAATIVADSRV